MEIIKGGEMEYKYYENAQINYVPFHHGSTSLLQPRIQPWCPLKWKVYTLSSNFSRISLKLWQIKQYQRVTNSTSRSVTYLWRFVKMCCSGSPCNLLWNPFPMNPFFSFYHQARQHLWRRRFSMFKYWYLRFNFLNSNSIWKQWTNSHTVGYVTANSNYILHFCIYDKCISKIRQTLQKKDERKSTLCDL